VVAKKKGEYFESHVMAIDKEAKTVHCVTSTGKEFELPYDKLVVGVGYRPNDFGIEGVAENALFMKETRDATVFKDHVLSKLEEASYLHLLDNDVEMSAEEEKKVREALTFVIVGGGPTGVELAGELTDFLAAEGARQYSRLKPFMKVYMLTYDVLNTFDENLQQYAMRHLEKKQGVTIHLGVFVQKVERDVVHVKGKSPSGEDTLFSIPYGTLVWCAGIKPHAFVKDYQFAMNDRKTQILVERTLNVKGEKDIFAVGDCSTIDRYWLPQTAQVANQEAIYLAKQLNAGTAGSGPPFIFRSLGMMAYLGGFNALMSKLPGLPSISGFLAFLGWRSVYWSMQLSFRNQYMLSTDWLRTMLFGRDLTRFGPRSSPK
jgi:NADH:ubiquinone reductase (non-electrogenic)